MLYRDSRRLGLPALMVSFWSGLRNISYLAGVLQMYPSSPVRQLPLLMNGLSLLITHLSFRRHLGRRHGLRIWELQRHVRVSTAHVHAVQAGEGL